MNCKLQHGLVFAVLNLWICQCSSNYRIPEQGLITDIPVHEGYTIKYSFKDHYYLDIVIIPSPNLNEWLAITLEKNPTGGNKIALQNYNGKDFDYIENVTSHIDVGQCKKINFIVHDAVIFLVVSRCSITTNKTEIIVVDEIKLSLVKIQTLPHSFVEDAQFWMNQFTGELNLIVLARQKLGSRKFGTLYHYIYNKENNTFDKNDAIKNTDPRSLTVFNIDDIAYIGVANYQDLIGDFVKSNIYVQDKQSGKLLKHQELTSKGAISLTYFCFKGETKLEHFLLSANNMHLKGPPTIKKASIRKIFPEESILYKWDDGYFVPFQTLLVRVPSPWIMVPSDSNVLIVLTWSYIDGIISYQYDGWTFRRTAILQKDIINESRYFAHFEVVSFAGETLFTIFTSKDGAKRKYFIVPKYLSNVKTRLDYNEKENWCRNAYLELRVAWNIFSSHYRYLADLCPTRNVNPEEKIMSLFGLIFGYNKASTKKNNGLEIMSLQGYPDNDVFEGRTSEYTQCTMNYTMTRMPGVTHIVGVENGFLTLKQSGIIKFYSLSQWKEFQDPSKGKTVYKIKNVTKITRFQYIKLCTGPGLFIEGLHNGKLFGNIYTINMHKLTLLRSLRLSDTSEIKSLCLNKKKECFIVRPSEGNIACSIQCPGITMPFLCGPNFQMETINWRGHSIIVGTSNNTIFQSIFNEGYLTTTTLKEVEIPSKLYVKASDEDFITLITNEQESEICRSTKPDEKLVMNITCSNVRIVPSSYKHITIGNIKKETALLVGTNDSISINILFKNHVMVLNKLNKTRYNVLEHFVVKKSNFLVLQEETNSSIVEFEYCNATLF